MAHDIRHILGPGGLLASHLPGYEPRPQQVEMAQGVQDAFQGNHALVVEAATGTGKTLAYLIPAILSGQCVVVSTATRALQEQIFLKDIPFLTQLFRKLRPARSFKAINIKGRTNYLCKLRFEQAQQTARFRTRQEADLFKKIERWAERTQTGDRAEIPGLPDDYAPWREITATGNQCVGSECEKFEECFVTQIRRQAKEAQIVVTNHHLFFADLALRSGSVSPILPDYDAVVFDEAHHLEETITSYFGYQASNFRVTELVGDTQRAIESGASVLSPAARRAIDELERASEAFFGSIERPEGRYPLAEALAGPRAQESERALQALRAELETFQGWVATADIGDQAERLASRTREVREDLERITGQAHPGFAYIAEVRGRGVFLEAAPIDVARIFEEKVLSVEGPQIYASATLTTGGTFDYFLGRLGMKREGAGAPRTLRLPPVFDYRRNALVYVPRRLPDPSAPEWLDGVCQIVEYLLKLTEGRAFVLFTSYRNMEQVHQRLKDSIPYRVLCQGEAPRLELLEEFRRDVSSVLFATGAFWEGVDVEGEALSLVILDKLPFANPTDPLVQARTRYAESRGANAFMHYAVPQAAIALKQGFGRLIRSQRDQGIVAILDSRIASKRYGRIFLESLPPASVVWNAREVRDWWAARASPPQASASAAAPRPA